MRVLCIIPTYNAKKLLSRLLGSLEIQSAVFDTAVVDSSSGDGSYELARAKADFVLSVPSQSFNHGGTRQMVIDQLPEYDLYVFLTQDVVLADEHSIGNLICKFEDKKIGAVYGKQLPHDDARSLAAHSRYFNYPENSVVKSIKDIPTLGIKTTFFSNSFGAYRSTALLDVSGFPSHIIFGEDAYVAAKIILSGWKIAYASDASCRHSHNYSLMDEFKRYFDIGVFHSREKWIKDSFGGANGEGLKFVKSELLYLGISKFYLWPESILRNALKLLAYRIGCKERYLPISLKRIISMHGTYWVSEFA